MNPIIIIPYRDRAAHLAKFLQHYRRLLPNAYYVIVEQTINGLFNRGMLLNIGFIQVEDKSDYFIFHDVDMLVQGIPDYSFTKNPTLLATNASQFNWQLPFPEYFGGVTGINREHFHLINGYPNDFWGWGGEDNAVYYALQAHGLPVIHRPHRYYSLPHMRLNAAGICPIKMQQAKQPRSKYNGLNGLKYAIKADRKILGGLHIVVEISQL